MYHNRQACLLFHSNQCMALLDGQVTFHAKLIMAYDVCMHVSMHAGVCVSVSVCV